MPDMLNAESMEFMGVSMGTVRRRAAWVKDIVIF